MKFPPEGGSLTGAGAGRGFSPVPGQLSGIS
jgi:hypothetical protein